MMQRSADFADKTSVEVGSFRDPDSRVFMTANGVFRLLTATGLEDFQALADTSLWGDLQEEGTVVATELAESAQLPQHVGVDAVAVLRHDRIPFVSYPYEWTFSMLQDAALLQLDLARRALKVDLTLKDASAYNVQWRGSRPVFIDIGSFERLRPGEPWAGYRQFCMLFLYPLMLQAYKDLPF